MQVQLIGALVTWLAGAALSAAPAAVMPNGMGQQDDGQIKAEVQRKLGGLEGGSRQVTASVQDGVVTLSGTVPSLWVKDDAIRRARSAGHVQSLVSEVSIARAENDETLGRQVVERVRKYDRYSVFDNVEVRIKNGVVGLSGAVTEPQKSSDILERVAKVRGVQAIDNKIVTLPSSQSDDQLRRAIVTAIYRDPSFENYSMVDPPIHVIVNNGHVTLVGYVRSQDELIKAESAARMVFGVLALDNRVELIGKANRTR